LNIDPTQPSPKAIKEEEESLQDKSTKVEARNGGIGMVYKNGHNGEGVKSFEFSYTGVISIAFIICRFIFFTYAILDGLHYSCRE
jgi:hypothetical protein